MAEAEKLQVQVIEISTRVLGEEHPDTLHSMDSLALIYSIHGRKEAEALQASKARLAEIRRRIAGGDEGDESTQLDTE